MLSALVFGTTLLLAADPAVEAEIRRLETALVDAVRDKDETTLDRLLASDYVLRGSPDITRDVWLKNAVSLCWGQGTIKDVRVHLDGTMAIATFDLTFDRDPTSCRPAVLRSLITDVWRRRDDTWELVVRHSGPAGTGLAVQFAVVPQTPAPFEVKAELSMVATGGNTSARTLGATTEAIHRGRRATTTGRFVFIRSTAEGEENARSLLAQARQGWRLWPRIEGFARGEYQRDLFAGVAHLATLEGGVSVAALPAPHSLRFDAGVGATSETRLALDDRQFASATGTIAYRWALSPLSELRADSSITSDLQRAVNWRSANSLSLLVAVNRVMSARIAYSLRYLNEPVSGFRNADTTASAALVLSYARRPR